EERHPLEYGRFVLEDVAGDLVAVDLVIAKFAPDELARIAGFGICSTFEGEDHVFRAEVGTVVPLDAFAYCHVNLGFVFAEAPFGKKARRKAEVGLLLNVTV